MTMMQNTKRRYLPCNVHGAAGSATALRLWLSIGLPPFQRLRPPPTTTTPTSSQFPNVSFSTRHFKPLFQSKLYQQKCAFLVLYLTTQQTCEVLLTFKTFDRINEGTRSEHPKDNNKNKDKTISEISVAPR